MPQSSAIHQIKSVAQLMRECGLPPPLHPLIALVDYDLFSPDALEKGKRISLDFYKVSFRPAFRGQTRYGQGFYDFEEGGLAFVKPGQVVTTPEDPAGYTGKALYFHRDLIRGFPLGIAIEKYGFFSYDVSEALFLSAREKETISIIFTAIAGELQNNIDQFSQDVLVSQIELLLNHSRRYYNRQFITRKTVNHQLITSLDNLLSAYFKKENGLDAGLPSVHQMTEALQVSQRYLSDMLRSLTGYNTQQYIQNRIIEESKDLLSATGLSVAEIAYKLGFEHPQSFSKLFKSRTNISPMAYRQSFN